jgi:hypothetical protein
MKGFIQATPRFELHLKDRMVEILIKESLMHYDTICKAASLRGGFLYGWNNTIKFNDFGNDSNSFFSTHRELDLTTKILENVSLNGLWSEGDNKLIKEYKKLVHNLITESYKLSDINEEISV